MLKEKKGITLIALIITIIVLLILAGIALTAIMGEDGILTKAEKAKIETRGATVQERRDFWIADVKTKKMLGETSKSLDEILQELLEQDLLTEEEVNEIKEDENNEIEIGSKVISFKLEDEKNPPIISINPSTEGKILTVEITASDNESNLDKLIWYYKLEEGEYLTEEVEYEEGVKGPITLSKTWELEKGTPLHAYVEVYDIYGNYSSTKDEKEIIVVYINSSVYYAYNGMTWKEFAQSGVCNRIKYYEATEWSSEHISGAGAALGNVPKPSDIIVSGWNTYTYQPAECVFPNSQIMTSLEGDYILAKEIKEGNNIAYYNFETERTEIGQVQKVYIHKNAINFVKYTFEDGTYLEATDYHPIYTKEGWKSYTQRNGYSIPEIGDKVKTKDGWKKITNIEIWTGLEDCYDFSVINEKGEKINNYYANNTLVQGSY